MNNNEINVFKKAAAEICGGVNMLLGKIKSVSPASQQTQCDRHSAQTPVKCPKTGRVLKSNRKYRWLIWVFPILGFFSLVWFLIRVIPKPSRATYPCQRFAAPFAGGFVIWIAGLIASAMAYRRARKYLYQSRYIVAGIFVIVSVMTVWLSVSITGQAPAEAAFTPTEPANSPMGVAKGINPGRVVWVHEPAATSWDGSTGSWWDDDNTNQDAVDYMVSKTIQTLTAESSDENAWDGLFRHFNQTRGLGDVGYQAPEKIAIKINMNQENSSGGNWSSRVGNPSPHVICSLLKQLIDVAGVPGSAITIYDASRYIGNPIYDKIKNNPNPDFQNITFVVKSTLARNGRIAANGDTANPLNTRAGTAYLPRCVTGAKYLINMALLRPHSLYGVTLCAKNHFGSVHFPSVSSNGGWTPEPLHNHGGRSRGMNTYNCLVNLNGHEHLSGKTLLYMIDGLYPAINQSSNVLKWASFGDDWCSSLFASQDPVAIDSVGLDFIRYEDGMNPSITDVTGNPENYMHEAAQADNPLSGTVYDPEGDGTPLGSLGVHEHWNNPIDKKYSRNLGTGDGIELVIPSFATADGPIENTTSGTKYDHIRHAINEAETGDKIVLSEGVYHENINFSGKNITLSSIDPGNPAVVAGTVLAGSAGPVVTFAGVEDESCMLDGFTITGPEAAIYCSGASPAITNCSIENNGGNGIELREGSNPAITYCESNSNAGSGIEMQAKQSGRMTIYNRPVISNCVIAGNIRYGISGGIPTITNCTIVANTGCGIFDSRPTVMNSIIYYNSAGTDAVQIDNDADTITYTDIQGGWQGQGNIDAAPCFAEPGFWNLNGTLDDVSDDYWVPGDYHLRSQAGRWHADSRTWLLDVLTSPCIDTGNPDSDYSAELPPNGDRINMGAYGGTP
ncbi:MAG: right-handed parallel beta-helix repeat-containing protein, partial [Sedimentisphaerales bacterium]